jgi:hypothetical protein
MYGSSEIQILNATVRTGSILIPTWVLQTSHETNGSNPPNQVLAQHGF